MMSLFAVPIQSRFLVIWLLICLRADVTDTEQCRYHGNSRTLALTSPTDITISQSTVHLQCSDVIVLRPTSQTGLDKEHHIGYAGINGRNGAHTSDITDNATCIRRHQGWNLLAETISTLGDGWHHWHVWVFRDYFWDSCIQSLIHNAHTNNAVFPIWLHIYQKIYKRYYKMFITMTWDTIFRFYKMLYPL